MNVFRSSNKIYVQIIDDFQGHTLASASSIDSELAASMKGLTNLEQAKKVGEALFPAAQAELITDLIRRDLPYYDTAISPAFVHGMSRFCQGVGTLDRSLTCDDVVSPLAR